MNKTTDQSFMQAWEQFWFAPADPSLLGLIRIACGMIVVYTLFAYTFNLQDLMGEHAWNDLEARMEIVRDRPMLSGPFTVEVLPEPRTELQRLHRNWFLEQYGAQPPPPYPENEEQDTYLRKFVEKYKADLRINGIRPPRTPEERAYVERYTQRHGFVPPAYPRDEAEEKAIDEYIDAHKTDPRRLATKGMRVFSLWFDITDPDTMAVLHVLIIVCAFLFTIGFCTRITSALTWFGSLCYIHRSPTTLFGVDTMMTIVLLYLMVGPCGAVFSVDALIRRWWVSAKPGVVQAWYRFWRKPVPSVAQIAPAASPEPVPSVSANVAIRLLQIHVGIVYLMSGLSKLMGNAWWTGEAVWGTLGNYEFAPMQFEVYLAFIGFLGRHKWIYYLFMTTGGLFTLAFEISYIFLVWRPRLRWVFLAGAIILHGFIGLFMGLKTFSMMMLVMNMAFLRKEEVYAIVDRIGRMLTWIWRPKAAVQPAAVAATPMRAGSNK
jgi:Vitamin K-dependent gamma-carboxylase